MKTDEKEKVFIDRDRLYDMVEGKAPSDIELQAILNKALKFKGLNLGEVASLLRVADPRRIHDIMQTAMEVKEHIYGRRLVFFAPLYTGNACINNCLYCAFRRDNKSMKRKVLSMAEIGREVSSLLREGHKRILMICGESSANETDYMCEAIRTAYSVREGKDYVRRINLEIAPLPVEDFRRLKEEKIGTYVCFSGDLRPGPLQGVPSRGHAKGGLRV